MKNWLRLPFETSAIVLVVGVLFLFALAIGAVVIAPRYIDSTWSTPNCSYQVQMYEVADPHLYINCNKGEAAPLTFVRSVANQYTLFSFEESEMLRIWAPPELESYVTRFGSHPPQLTSRLLLLRAPSDAVIDQVIKMQETLQDQWLDKHPDWEKEALSKPFYIILELYDPKKEEAFVLADTDGILEAWAPGPVKLLGKAPPYLSDEGAIYVKNPQEYLVKQEGKQWVYHVDGRPIADLKELGSAEFGFVSRQHLIAAGEQIYKEEGCWYCHTDQSRTLVQDCVINGSEDYPAPPSSAHEYIYQEVTFPGTRRIGPDLARVGIKQPSRDWHKGHFWAPESKSKGSIMPAYRQFFFDAKESASDGRANCAFESIYQYLMTKGTRLTPPHLGWWTGKDPLSTLTIIEKERQ